jgi:hypothetical protein
LVAKHQSEAAPEHGTEVFGSVGQESANMS